MKKLIFALLIISAAFSACNKTTTVVSDCTVVRDCTGTYLRWNEKDYQVCNFEKLDRFLAGAQITATFTKIKECSRYETIPVCYMYHASEGWIEVEKIK